MVFIQIFIFILVLSGFLIAVSPMKYKGIVAIVSVLILVTLTSYCSIGVLMGNPIELILSGSLVTGAIPIVIDPLSAWFILVINFTFVTGAFYGHHYLKAYQMPSANVSMHWISFIIA